MKKYFAYGSCTNMKDFEKTLATVGCQNKFRTLGIGRFEGYKLAFTRLKGDGTGALDMVESEGDYVLGVVYEVDEEAIKAIDRREGHPHCYERRQINVTLINREAEVFTYFVVDKKLVEVCPSEEYLNKCLEGMRIWLPDDYVNKYFITHVNEKFGLGYDMISGEVKHVTLADAVKDMTPEQLASFQKERYEKFIKPMGGFKITTNDNSIKDEIIKKKLQ